MKAIFVAGAWGSGTTMVAGALARLGVPSFGPFFQSNDPRTPNTFELIPFRDAILPFVDEHRLEIKAPDPAAVEAALAEFRDKLDRGTFGPWPDQGERRVVLKMPIASIFLPQLLKVFDMDVIVVHRPFQEIEVSRRRRNWPPAFGGRGAAAIYPKLFNDILVTGTSCLMLSFSDLRRWPTESLAQIIDYCGLGDLADNLTAAASFIRRD